MKSAVDDHRFIPQSKSKTCNLITPPYLWISVKG